MDTIISLSSGSLPSGVAVLRCSGPQAQKIASVFSQIALKPREAHLARLVDHTGEVIDSGLVIWFPAPNSFTGEDVVEFQVHGGKAVVSKLLDEAIRVPGVRQAEAGEFARRAFSNGKIDLTEAEGLADLIDAETEAQRVVAQYLASGGLKRWYQGWQDQLLNARALIEADIDFADEDDVPGSVADKVWSDVRRLKENIETHLAEHGRSEKIRDGFRISLLGPPNAGKSSLLNALAGSDRVIVSEEAGTTRDVVEVRLDLGGYLVLVSDTAGIREDAGAIEQEGIRRSIESAKTADLVLLLSEDGKWFELKDYGTPVVRTLTKTDLSVKSNHSTDLYVSVKDQASFQSFLDGLIERIKLQFGNSQHSNALKSRYIDHLQICCQMIEEALDELAPLEIRAEKLRSAAFSLGRITGQHDTEDVLGRIFSSFCIGK